MPTAANSTPPDVGQVVDTANRLFGAIPTGDLNTFFHELGVALNGRGDDIHNLISSGAQLAQELNANQAQFQTLLNNAPPFFDTLSANGPAFNQALTNTEVLTQVLAQHSHDIVNLMNNGATAASVIQQLVLGSRPNLACLTHDLADFTSNVDQPANMTNLAALFAGDTKFATTLNTIGVKQYPLGPKAPSPGPTEQLRIHILLPPPQPSGAAVPDGPQPPARLPGARLQHRVRRRRGPGDPDQRSAAGAVLLGQPAATGAGIGLPGPGRRSSRPGARGTLPLPTSRPRAGQERSPCCCSSSCRVRRCCASGPAWRTFASRGRNSRGATPWFSHAASSVASAKLPLIGVRHEQPRRPRRASRRPRVSSRREGARRPLDRDRDGRRERAQRRPARPDGRAEPQRRRRPGGGRRRGHPGRRRRSAGPGADRGSRGR